MLIQEVTNKDGQAVEFFSNKTDAVRSLKKEHMGCHLNTRDLDKKADYIVFLNDLLRRNSGFQHTSPGVVEEPESDDIEDML